METKDLGAPGLRCLRRRRGRGDLPLGAAGDDVRSARPAPALPRAPATAQSLGRFSSIWFLVDLAFAPKGLPHFETYHTYPTLCLKGVLNFPFQLFNHQLLGFG